MALVQDPDFNITKNRLQRGRSSRAGFTPRGAPVQKKCGGPWTLSSPVIGCDATGAKFCKIWPLRHSGFETKQHIGHLTRSLAIAKRACDCCIILKSGSYTKAI